MGRKVRVARSESDAKMIFECADCTFGGVAVVGIRGDKLEDNIVLVEERFALCVRTCYQGCGEWGLQHSGVGVRVMLSRLY